MLTVLAVLLLIMAILLHRELRAIRMGVGLIRSCIELPKAGWEYKTVMLINEEGERTDWLNPEGLDRWELVCVLLEKSDNIKWIRAIMKRPMLRPE